MGTFWGYPLVEGLTLEEQLLFFRDLSSHLPSWAYIYLPPHDMLLEFPPNSSRVIGFLPWSATLTAQDLSRDRGNNPMVVRKKKNASGEYIACTDGAGLEANETCTHGFVYEKVALLDENGDSIISGRTEFPSVGCRNDHDHGSQCFPPHALTDNGFVHGGAAYRIAGVTLSGGTLTFTLDRPVPANLKAVAMLFVSTGAHTGIDLALADASHINGALQWGDTGLSWSAEDPASTATLRLHVMQGGEGPGSGGEEERDPLTASFEEVPGAHDGAEFAFLVRLSETVGKFSRSPRATGGRCRTRRPRPSAARRSSRNRRRPGP